MKELLEDALKKGIVEPIDHLLADHFSALCGNDFAIKLLLIHLSIALRFGITSLVRQKEKGILPTVSQLWQPVDEIGVQWVKEHSQSVQNYLEEGWQRLLRLPKTARAIHCTEDLLQWQRWQKARAAIEQLLALRQETTPSITIDPKKLDDLVSYWQEKGLLNERQMEAISLCGSSTLCLISGGPGTGKTYTAAFIVQMVQELKEKNGKETELRCALAAPTGKAAATLAQRIQAELIRQEAAMPQLYSSTIHSLIASAERASSSLQTLPYDLIIVDESSMIDELMMAKLLIFTAPKTRLVLMGDHCQLPPVEPGAPFKELCLKLGSDEKPYKGVSLTQCVRTDVPEIMEISSLLRFGQKKEVKKLLESTKNNRALFWRYKKLPNAPQRLIAEMAALLQQNDDRRTEASIGLLTPMRQGVWGTQELNQAIRAELLKRWRHGQPFMAPIMVTVNDYKMQLFNGDTGLLVMQNPYQGCQKEDYAVFVSSDLKEPKRRVSSLLLPRYEFAWCLSVHKSQGSEFDTVVVLLPAGSESFGDELLYTAVTRARKRVEIWGAI